MAQMATTAQSPSQQIHAALLRKGYRVLAQHAARTNRRLVFTLYAKQAQVCLLQTLSEEDGSQSCELYRPVVESNSLADTIAAIP